MANKKVKLIFATPSVDQIWIAALPSLISLQFLMFGDCLLTDGLKVLFTDITPIPWFVPLLNGTVLDAFIRTYFVNSKV